MKITVEEIEQVINNLATAVTYAKEARRVAKKVYGDAREVAFNLKYAYEEVQKATKVLEGQGQ